MTSTSDQSFHAIQSVLKVGDRRSASKPATSRKPSDQVKQIHSRSVIGRDNRITVPDPTVSPYAPIGRITSRWKGADGQLYTADDKVYTSSGTLISDYHVLTAAHCLYNKNEGGFADAIEFIPGSSGKVISNRSSKDALAADNEYYGRAKATYMRSFSGYSQNSNWTFDNSKPPGKKWSRKSDDDDMGVLTLDRNMGKLTGSFGYGYNAGFKVNTVVNATGYPADRFGRDEFGSWENFNMTTQSGKITKVTAAQLQSNDLDYNGGNSGGPVWIGNKTIYGVVATESPSSNDATRITAEKFKAIGDWIKQDDAARKPIDKPDLIDYATWFGKDIGGFIVNGSGTATTAYAGQSFHTNLWVQNVGTVAATNFSVNFYLSTDNDVTNSIGTHYLLGTASGLSASATRYALAANNSTVPNVPLGTYYVIAFIDPNNAIGEYDDSIASNQRVYSSFLTVQAAPQADVESLYSYTLQTGEINLTLTGSGAIDGTGNELNNTIFGNAAANTLSGNSGMDTLVGAGGTDTLIGGSDNDYLNGYGSVLTDESQFDNLYGGTGVDIFVLGGAWGTSYVESGDGYAVIQDWDGSDKIQVKGSSSSYRLDVKGTDTEIYFVSGSTNDRIGLVKGVTNLSLSRDFNFV